MVRKHGVCFIVDGRDGLTVVQGRIIYFLKEKKYISKKIYIYKLFLSVRPSTVYWSISWCLERTMPFVFQPSASDLPAGWIHYQVFFFFCLFLLKNPPWDVKLSKTGMAPASYLMALGNPLFWLIQVQGICWVVADSTLHLNSALPSLWLAGRTTL